ncbi:MAG: hypothetical protein HKN03_00690 [Acidimicrobiales bacterium]|nr:hypothetical protein [Acidimicrobiales bacterium]
MARQAQSFEGISVWTLEQTSIEPVEAEPLPEVPPIGSPAEAHRALFESVGADVVDDFGRLVAEVRGLEIARSDAITGQLEIGVGTADRELHGYVHSGTDPSEFLAKAADFARSIRSSGAPGHPLNRQGRQRWLRSAAFHDPSLLNAGILEMLPPLDSRVLQLGPEPAAAIDRSTNTLYVFVAGVDPEAVPVASDYQLRHTPAATVIVTTELDRFPATEEIAASVGIRTRALPSPW